jgi:hypothetical protein
MNPARRIRKIGVIPDTFSTASIGRLIRNSKTVARRAIDAIWKIGSTWWFRSGDSKWSYNTVKTTYIWMTTGLTRHATLLHKRWLLEVRMDTYKNGT